MYKETARSLSDSFKTGKRSALEIANYFLNRIEQGEAKTDAFLTVLSDRMRHKARELDTKRAQGKPLGKLAAIPIALKDNMHVQGELTTCASKFLSNFKAPFDATITRLLEEEDALIIGKTNLDEFAMGSSTENSAFKTTKNPWNLSCTPGGSSGGSAVAVAARYCPLALGSDTGGSVRQPAAFSGVFGFKPTYGRVSRYGLVAFASSLDQIGPFANNVGDMALLMEVIGAHCTKDSTSLAIPHDHHLPFIDKPLTGQAIGVPWDFLTKLDKEAKENFDQSIEVMKNLGATIVNVDLSLLEHSIAVYYILATAEASTNLARFDGIRYGVRSDKARTLDEVYEYSKQEGFGKEVKNRILLGTYVLSSGYKDAYYRKAQKVRTLVIEQYKKAFKTCQWIAMPTSPFAAFTLGAIQDPVQMYLQDIYTIGPNLAGLPAISIPSGFSHEHKPFGFQLIGPALHDKQVLQAAHAFEKATFFHNQIPPLFDKEVL